MVDGQYLSPPHTHTHDRWDGDHLSRNVTLCCVCARERRITLSAERSFQPAMSLFQTCCALFEFSRPSSKYPSCRVAWEFKIFARENQKAF